MAKIGNILLLTAVTVLGFNAVRKGKAAKKLEFYFKNVDWSKLSFTNFKVTGIIDVVNPSQVNQDVDAVFANVFLDDKQIGRVQMTDKIVIPKQSTTVVKVPLEIFPAGAGSIIAKVLQGKAPNVKVVGTVSSMGIVIPFDFLVGG